MKSLPTQVTKFIVICVAILVIIPSLSMQAWSARAPTSSIRSVTIYPSRAVADTKSPATVHVGGVSFGMWAWWNGNEFCYAIRKNHEGAIAKVVCTPHVREGNLITIWLGNGGYVVFRIVGDGLNIVSSQRPRLFRIQGDPGTSPADDLVELMLGSLDDVSDEPGLPDDLELLPRIVLTPEQVMELIGAHPEVFDLHENDSLDNYVAEPGS